MDKEERLEDQLRSLNKLVEEQETETVRRATSLQIAHEKIGETTAELQMKIPVTYPTTAPEIAIPELDGKTAKMYRGGKICMTDHFKPLWARNVPKFGIAHAMALGLGPWLAVEIPDLIQKGLVQHKQRTQE